MVKQVKISGGSRLPGTQVCGIRIETNGPHNIVAADGFGMMDLKSGCSRRSNLRI